jgi:UDP-glucuronate 4-epimerase
MTILVTGAAGFIGAHVVKRLITNNQPVVGLDVVNDYYDPKLKWDRLAWVGDVPFEQIDIADKPALDQVFQAHKPTRVIHLAAQAGVRYSIENPDAYIHSNIIGFQNMLECCKNHSVTHLAYASSSSVYGNNEKIPFSTSDPVDHPVSTYAATKKSNELMAHVYSHLYQLPTTGLRFFTVYGPWGRPDMSPFLFANAIFRGEEIKLFNRGHHRRDFTYVDDIVEGVIRVLNHVPAAGVAGAPYKVYNIGNNTPVELMTYVDTIERLIGKPAIKKLVGPQPGDVDTTFADIEDLQNDVGYRPRTDLDDGLSKFISWFKDYYDL